MSGLRFEVRFLALVSAFACAEGDQGQYIVDNDGDGAEAAVDCNDENPAVNPKAVEVCDGIDNDCDGVIDPPDDADGDTYPACIQDCNDQNATINPGAKEVCDGIDNDCSGAADDGEDLCGMVPNGTVTCAGQMGCQVADCDPDWYDANGVSQDGCECLSDPLPETVGAACERAVSVGVLQDAAPMTVSRAGNAAFAGREIWYAFEAIDDVDTNGDEFHVDVRFAANPDAGYAIAVYRNGCPGTGEELATAEPTVFDWFTDQPFSQTGCSGTPPCGEGDCSTIPNDPDKNLCSDNSATFHVRVYRPDGVASCDAYALEFSNGVY